MIGSIGAASSAWMPLATVRREPIQAVRSTPVFEVPPVRAITDRAVAFAGYSANGQPANSGQPGRNVDRLA